MYNAQNLNRSPELHVKSAPIDAERHRADQLSRALANEQIAYDRSHTPKHGILSGYIKPIAAVSVPQSPPVPQSDAERVTAAQANVTDSLRPQPFFEQYTRMIPNQPDVVESHYQVEANPAVAPDLSSIGYRQIESEPDFNQERPYVTV